MRKLYVNALSAGIQTISSAVLLFFLYRYLLGQLGPEQLGVWSVVLASVSIGRLTDMGFAGTALKFVAAALGRDEQKKAADIIQTAAISIVVVLGLAVLLILPLVKILLAWAIPEQQIPLAIEILPYALATLLVTMVGGIFQSGIDACRRMYLKNILLISGNVLFIALALWLVPRQGLLGVAVAQLLQSIFLLLGSWAMLRHLLPALPLLPFRWRKAEFKETLGYAANFQIGMVAGLLFDPLTKILLARFGDLTLTAYFDMANQLVQKARAVVVSAQQALVPEIATLRDDDQESRVKLFSQAYSMSLVVIVPYFIGIALSLPLISWLWIGHYQGSFVFFGTLICAGWFSASLGAVSYFYNQGTAELIWNTLNHVATGAFNLSLGWLLGMVYAGSGVVIAAAIALAVPNLALNLKVLHRLGLPWSQSIPSRHRLYCLLVCLAGIGLGLAAAWQGWYLSGPIQSSFVIIGFAAVLPFVLMLDPSGKMLIQRVRQRFSTS